MTKARLSILSMLLVSVWTVPASAQIHVIAGTYGQNCRQPRGNKTDHLARACNGKQNCHYTINYRVIGDPAVGCAKSYIAEWKCGGSPRIFRASVKPEAGFNKLLKLSCSRNAPPPVVKTPVGTRGTIQVRAGTYGGNCRQPRGNKTAHLARSCNGRKHCTYTVDYRVIGDPARGCGKNYIAEWSCGTTIYRAQVAPEAGYRRPIALACP